MNKSELVGRVSESIDGGRTSATRAVEAVIARLMDAVEADPTTPITVDLERCEVRGAEITENFQIDSGVRHRLLNGLDDIALTLQSESDISAFEARRPTWLPTTV